MAARLRRSDSEMERRQRRAGRSEKAHMLKARKYNSKKYAHFQAMPAKPTIQ